MQLSVAYMRVVAGINSMVGKPEYLENEALYAACLQYGSDIQLEAYQQLSLHVYRIAYSMLYNQPAGAELAADSMQTALLKIHQNIQQCREPAAFRAWAGQITRRVVLDILRPMNVQRTEYLTEDTHLPASAHIPPPADPDELAMVLRKALTSANLSERSRRVVIGRFFEERDDNDLAQVESTLAGQPILPCHIQVTRAKNLAKLRADRNLLAQLREVLESA